MKIATLIGLLALTACGTVQLQYQAGDGNICNAKGSGLLGAHYADQQFEKCVNRHPTAGGGFTAEPQ